MTEPLEIKSLEGDAQIIEFLTEPIKSNRAPSEATHHIEDSRGYRVYVKIGRLNETHSQDYISPISTSEKGRYL